LPAQLWLFRVAYVIRAPSQRSLDSSRARAQRELKKASEAAKQLARARAMVADTEAAIQALNAQVWPGCDAVSLGRVSS